MESNRGIWKGDNSLLKDLGELNVLFLQCLAGLQSIVDRSIRLPLMTAPENI